MGKIHDAAKAGKAAKVQMLLHQGKCGVNDRDRKNRTALHMACSSGHPRVVSLLVERKCDIDACDSKNHTALIKAVKCGQVDCVSILLEHGADPNVVDAGGLTPLHHAAYRNDLLITAKLLSHNADIKAKNKAGLTPISFALKHKRPEVAAFLTEKKEYIQAVEEESIGEITFEVEEQSYKHSENTNSGQQTTSEETEEKLDRRENSQSLNTSDALQMNCDDYFPETDYFSTEEDQGIKCTVNENVEESDLDLTGDQQKSLESSEHSKVLVEKQRKHPRRNVTKVSENPWDAASPKDTNGDGDGLHHQRRSAKADFQQFPIKRNKARKELVKKMSDENNKVFIGHENAKDLLHKMDVLHDDIAMLKLERETNNQVHERERKYIEHIESLREKMNDFQKTVNLKDETIRQLTAEIAVLKFQLKSERRSREAEDSRLATASRGCDQTQPSKRDLDHASQRGRDERNTCTSHLENDRKFLSHVCKCERRFGGLETQLSHVRDDIGKNTQVLEHLQRDIRQMQQQIKEAERVQKNEERKASKTAGKKEPEGKKSSQPQSEQVQLHEDKKQDPQEVNFFEKLQIHIQKLQLENSTLKVTVKNQAEQIEQLQTDLLKGNKEILHKKMLHERCEKLQKESNKLLEEINKLQRLKERNTDLHSQVERYQREAFEANKALETKLQQVNVILQEEAQRQEHENELRESNMAAQRSKLELRIKDLESEVFQTTAQMNSTKTELEEFKQLYKEERKIRKSLSREVKDLHRTTYILNETRSRLQKLQQHVNSLLVVVRLHERDLQGTMFQQRLHYVDTEINEVFAQLQHGTT